MAVVVVVVGGGWGGVGVYIHSGAGLQNFWS